jgi:transcriptional regulator with XRE-family HTH domain
LSEDEASAELRAFATRLREVRKARQITQAEAARQLGTDMSYLSDIERLRANPSLHMMRLIATWAGLDLCDMLCITKAHCPAPGSKPRAR